MVVLNWGALVLLGGLKVLVGGLRVEGVEGGLLIDDID